MGTRRMIVALLTAGMALGCSSSDSQNPKDIAQQDQGTQDQPGTDIPADVPGPEDDLATPVADPDAAARAFKLYYAERLERSVLAYNRFLLFGDVTFGTTIGKSAIARNGDQWEIVGGPKDNNHIGESLYTAWNAYKVFRTRQLELTVIRMLEGLVFYEAVSGHPGLTARSVYPGWTRYVDGFAASVERTRAGAPVVHPFPADPALESEMIEAFWSGGKYTYREDPEDILLNYMPTAEMDEYMVTYSFNMLPDFLRVSDCCASLKRVPSPYDWEGAYFSNHNSRDNFPDLAIGFVVAMEAAQDTAASPQLRQSADRAIAAGKRVGDLIWQHEGKLMTVDEHNPYDTLVVSGAVRPDGTVEAETLGELSDCQMVFLSRAVSSKGLSLPLPELPAPGSVEFLMKDVVGETECPVPEPVRMCKGLSDGYCGKTWATMGELKFMGKPWLEFIRQLDEGEPGTAKELIGGFQDDFTEKTLAALALTLYARLSGDEELIAEAQEGLKEITALMRLFGELIWERTDPAQLSERVYRMALYETSGGLPAPLTDFHEFAMADEQMTRLESLLELADTQPRALVTDEQIAQMAEARLDELPDEVRQRYEAAYAGEHPMRRSGEGYEGRMFHNGSATAWRPMENQHHQVVGGFHFLEAAPLCAEAPSILDCTWAKLGCARVDLDGNGIVDATDEATFNAALAASAGKACGSANSWCDGADLDHTGKADATDSAFLKAAMGCHYTPAAR